MIYMSIITTNYRSAKEVFLSKKKIAQIEANLSQEDYNFDVRINNNPVYFNSVENVYYFYLSEEYADKYVDLKLKFKSTEKFEYVVLNEKYNKEKGLFIDFEQPLEIILFNDIVSYKKTIKFTCVPIININVASEINLVEQAALLEIYSKDYNNTNLIKKENVEALIRTRGGSSSFYPKKQYRLKLRAEDDYFQTSLLGMEADEDWILDALYSDYSKIRNKLSFEIWNEMHNLTSDKVSTELYAEYAEVYINDEYQGIYMLKEFLDWKKLGLDKNNKNGSGVLIKGAAYADFSWDGYEPVKHTEMVYPFIMKYPKLQDDYTKYWDAIMPRIYTHFFDRENITEDYLVKNFNIENYNDYKLLMNFICADDNFKEKNAVVSIKNLYENTNVILTPWDLDMTYGYAWGASPTSLYEEEENLYKIDGLWVNSENINNQLKERYKELREKVYNMENVNKKIDSYYNQIKYIVPRDSEKWLETDLEVEINKIRNWIEKRIELLDKEILG